MGVFFAGREVQSLLSGTEVKGIKVWRLRLEENEIGHMACQMGQAMTFLIVHRGTMTCQVNQKKERISTGEGLFINCGQAFRFVEGNSGGCEFGVIMIEPDRAEESVLLRQYVDLVAESKDFPDLKLEALHTYQEKLLENLNALERTALEKGLCYELQLKSLQYSVWAGIFREFTRISPVQKNAVHRETKKLCNMLAFLHEHYAEKVTLAALAENSGVSTGEYCRFFKKRMGQTPFEYLQTYRIERTLPELLDKTDSITQIALRHGFTGSSYYAETFKKEMGCAPGDYRKWCRRETEGPCPLSGKAGQQTTRHQEGRRQEPMPAHLL